MKRKILSVIIGAGLATCAFGQEVILDDTANSGGVGATTGGLVYINTGGGAVLFDGVNYNLGVTVMAGSSSGSLSLVGTYTPLTDSKGYTGQDMGMFRLDTAGLGVTMPGVSAGGTAWIQLQIWDYDDPSNTGTFASYAAAVAGKDWVATVLFQNPTSNPTAGPPIPPGSLVGMPSVVLVPEPTTLALAGLGLASLLVLRRKA